ncbi:MAG: transposase, partial [Alphaproteobacteria bacterium]|nr:transposase [Alphaproteobacteria bacterium]
MRHTVLDVVVEPGNRHTSKTSHPHLWDLLGRMGQEHWPSLVRGDKDWGNERNRARCEQEGLPYLFKQRMTKGVRRVVEKMVGRGGWRDAGQGWSGCKAELRLSGWSRQRQVVILRRPLRETLALVRTNDDGQGELFWADAAGSDTVWEFAVLVTSLDLEVLSLAQLYRDRADSENPFDELKNQWGWAGFTTRDIKRCQIMARLIALFYNWWSLF